MCKIAADRDGIFICQENRLLKFNRMSSKVVLNTIAPYQNVRKGEVIAVLSVCPPALEEELLEEIDFKLSGNEPLLSVEETKNEQAAVIYTKFYDDAAENRHFPQSCAKWLKTTRRSVWNLLPNTAVRIPLTALPKRWPTPPAGTAS